MATYVVYDIYPKYFLNSKNLDVVIILKHRNSPLSIKLLVHHSLIVLHPAVCTMGQCNVLGSGLMLQQCDYNLA